MSPNELKDKLNNDNANNTQNNKSESSQTEKSADESIRSLNMAVVLLNESQKKQNARLDKLNKFESSGNVKLDNVNTLLNQQEQTSKKMKNIANSLELTMNSLSNERQKEGQAFNQLTTAIKKQRLTVDSQPVANVIANYLNNGTIKLADNLSKSLENSLERSVSDMEHNIQNNLKSLREADNGLKNDLEAVEQEKTELNNKIEQEKKIHKQIQKLMIPFGMLILFAVGIFLWFKSLASIPFVSEAYHVILNGTFKNWELIVIALLMILLTFIAPFWFFNWITRRTLCRVCGITKEDIEDDINEDDEPAWLRYCENHMSDFGAKVADFIAVYIVGSERRAKKRVAWRLIYQTLFR